MIKWWERFWGLVWMVGTVAIAYATARWMATNAAPLDLGNLRYGLIGAAGLFGLLIGALAVSLIVIGLMSLLERVLARAGYQMRPPEALVATPEAPLVEPADLVPNADPFSEPTKHEAPA